MKNFGTSSCKQSSKLANADANMEHIHSHNKTRSDTDLFFKPMKTHKQHRVTDMFKSAMKISTSLQMNIFKTKNNHGTKVDSAKMIKKSTSGSFYSLPSGSCSDSALFLGRYLYSTSTIAQAQPSSEQQHCDKLDINDEQSHATESTIELASVPMTNTKAIVANTLKLRVPSADCINRSITSKQCCSQPIASMLGCTLPSIVITPPSCQHDSETKSRSYVWSDRPIVPTLRKHGQPRTVLHLSKASVPSLSDAPRSNTFTTPAWARYNTLIVPRKPMPRRRNQVNSQFDTHHSYACTMLADGNITNATLHSPRPTRSTNGQIAQANGIAMPDSNYNLSFDVRNRRALTPPLPPTKLRTLFNRRTRSVSNLHMERIQHSGKTCDTVSQKTASTIVHHLTAPCGVSIEGALPSPPIGNTPRRV